MREVLRSMPLLVLSVACYSTSADLPPQSASAVRCSRPAVITATGIGSVAEASAHSALADRPFVFTGSAGSSEKTALKDLFEFPIRSGLNTSPRRVWETSSSFFISQEPACAGNLCPLETSSAPRRPILRFVERYSPSTELKSTISRRRPLQWLKGRCASRRKKRSNETYSEPVPPQQPFPVLGGGGCTSQIAPGDAQRILSNYPQFEERLPEKCP